jgi:hypothetical protein
VLVERCCDGRNDVQPLACRSLIVGMRGLLPACVLAPVARPRRALAAWLSASCHGLHGTTGSARERLSSSTTAANAMAVVPWVGDSLNGITKGSLSVPAGKRRHLDQGGYRSAARLEGTVSVTRDLGTQVEVDDGVVQGDQVIINPPVTLGEGSKVRARIKRPGPSA